jgi:DNA-binding winged helix-turn-helix (wHTH) protein/tetratricopeptide (TPR) repeat protein
MASADVSAGAGTGDFGRILWHLHNDAMPIDSPHWACFGPFELDVRAGELHIDGQRVRLQNQPLQLLVLLLERAGEVVTQDAIRARLWANDTVVEFELSIGTAIRKLRHALGDDASMPRYIETLPRRGYRWLVPVTWAEARTTGELEGGRAGVSAMERGAAASEPAASAHGHLVGRADSLDVLRDCLGRALRHERQLVFITGEPGIGKTTLVDEFQRQAAPAIRGRIARGQCVERYGSQEPYYPVLEALGHLCRRSGGDAIVQILAAQAPTWLVQFPALLTREHREVLQREIHGATRERMLREIAEALELITESEPLLLVFEDLQWVDSSTIDLFSAVARRRGRAQLLVITTMRPVDNALPGAPLKMLRDDLLIHQLCREIALQPLSEADIAQYLAAESPGGAIPEALVGVVYRHSEGNPLFMAAVLEHLTGRGFIASENGGWQLRRPLEDIHLEVPERLRQLVEAQVDRLPAAEQRTLEAASVVGATFSASNTAAAADLTVEDTEEICDGLTRRSHLVRATGFRQFPNGTVSSQYQFVHALYREVLYDRLGTARRARLHLCAAERLEALCAENLSDVASELADHFKQGSDWSRAVKYLRLAADASRRRLAQREATAFLQSALALVHHLPEGERAPAEIALLQALATTYIAVFQLGNEGPLGADRGGIAGSYEDGAREFETALTTYQVLADRAAHYGLIDIEARALIEQAYPMSWVSSQRSLDALERARRLGDRHNDPLMRARIHSSCAAGRIWAIGWDPRVAEECREANSEISQNADRTVLAQHQSDLGVIQWASSRYREALLSAAESLPILAEELVKDPYLASAHTKSEMIAGWSLILLGQLGMALHETQAAIAVMEKNGNHYRAKTMQLYVALVYLHALDFPGILAICESVFPSVNHPARTIERRLCLALAGLAETALGSHAAACEHLSRAREEMDRYDVECSWWVRMLVEQGFTESLLARRELEQARRQAERFLEVTLATADRMHQALAWEANARLAMAESNLVRADDCIGKAVITIAGFEVPLAAWRVHATAAECSARAGDRRAAARHRKLSRTTILDLANSLHSEEPLQGIFLSAPAVRAVLTR